MQTGGSDYRPFCLAIRVPERAFMDRVVSWAEFTWVCREGKACGPPEPLLSGEARRGRNRAQGADETPGGHTARRSAVRVSREVEESGEEGPSAAVVLGTQL